MLLRRLLSCLPLIILLLWRRVPNIRKLLLVLMPRLLRIFSAEVPVITLRRIKALLLFDKS